MKKIFSLTYLFCCAFYAQSQTIDWFETIGTKQRDYYPDWNHIRLAGMEADDSMVVVAGSSRNYPIHFYRAKDSLTFPIFNWGIENRFIAQYSSDGQLRWKKKLGGGYTATDNAALAFHKGNTYFASVFSENMVLDADTFRAIQSKLFLLKLDKQGKRTWLKLSTSFFYSSDFIPRKIIVDDDENVYLFGDASGAIPLVFGDKTLEDNLYQFVFKFDKNGTPLSVVSFKEKDPKKWSSRLFDANIDKKGHVYALFSDGGLNVSSSCKYSSWRSSVFDIAPNGTVQRLFNITSDDLMTASSFIRMPNGDFIITGSYRGQLRINRFVSEEQDCSKTISFLTRVTADGRVLWFKKGESSLFSHGFDLENEDDFSFITVGIQNYNEPNRDPNLSTNFPSGRARLFVKRISVSGQTIDETTYNANAYDLAFYDFKVKKSKNALFIAGNYECYFDKVLESTCANGEARGQKIFLLKTGKDVLKKAVLQPIFGEKDVFIEPNPTLDIAFFRLNKAINAELSLKLYDLNGRLRQSKTVDGRILYHHLDMTALGAGVYFLNIQSDDFKVTKKIVKQ